MESQIKQAYSAPRLVEYGRVEDITRGWGSGRNDFFYGGHGDWDPPHEHGHTSS